MSSDRADPLLVEVEEGVAFLTLNRPEKRNALNAVLVGRLREAIPELENDDAVRVLALQGAGKDFCAGADLREIQRAADGPVTENLAHAAVLGDLFIQLRKSPKPSVAIVRGRALAGGCGLASACDLVLAERSARFGYPEVGIGFVPAMVMAILRRNVGEKRAFELVALGETIDAAEAERIGLVNRLFEDQELEAGAAELLRTLAGRSATAVALSKRLLYDQEGMSFDAGIRAGAEINVIARLTADARAGIAAFLSQRGGG
ncbi:MAG TPA: enoyl-CoA hydratase-related protein [Longimicrobiaceae bacterium]